MSCIYATIIAQPEVHLQATHRVLIIRQTQKSLLHTTHRLFLRDTSKRRGPRRHKLSLPLYCQYRRPVLLMLLSPRAARHPGGLRIGGGSCCDRMSWCRLRVLNDAPIYILCSCQFLFTGGLLLLNVIKFAEGAVKMLPLANYNFYLAVLLGLHFHPNFAQVSHLCSKKLGIGLFPLRLLF